MLRPGYRVRRQETSAPETNMATTSAKKRARLTRGECKEGTPEAGSAESLAP